jgi:hypothetical protein
MIFPTTVYNKLETYYFIWISGENGAGKTALALDLAESYLKSNFRLMSNLNCVWNDPFPFELDSNIQLNCIVILDEVGTFMRTKESIRRIMGFKRKLNTLFLMPSTEAPHEDLWTNFIEPHSLINEKIILPFFGKWFYENVLKCWRFVSFNPRKGYKETIFFQIFPARVYRLYSTLSAGTDPETILQVFDNSFVAQQRLLGNENPLKLLDVATGRSQAGESSSFLQQQILTRAAPDQRGLFSSKKARK